MSKVTAQFFQAAKIGQLDVLRNTLDATPEAHKAFSGGMQALHYAARYNQAAAVELLLSKGAEIDSRCPNGMTAICLATTTPALDTIPVLISKGADLNICDINGNSPLAWALKHQQLKREQMSNMLLAGGAQFGLAEAVCKGDAEAVRSIFQDNPTAALDVIQPPAVLLRLLTFGRFEGETAGHVDIFKLLMAHGWKVSNDLLLDEAQGCADSNRPLLAAAIRAYMTSGAAQADPPKNKSKPPKKKKGKG